MPSKKKTKTQSTQNTTTTTRPNTPSFLADPTRRFVSGSLNNVLDADPNQFVTGASPLQQAAFDRLTPGDGALYSQQQRSSAAVPPISAYGSNGGRTASATAIRAKRHARHTRPVYSGIYGGLRLGQSSGQFRGKYL